MSKRSGFWRALGGLAAAMGAALLAVAAPALAAGGAEEPEHHHWHFAGPFGTFDRAAMQRGYQVYREVCAACHSMDLISFRNLAQAGGPFFDEEYANPNDNPVIKALAAEFQITDGPDDTGELFQRAGRPSDAFPAPFANEPIARAANGGALPPDLSVIAKARAHGPDYIRSLMLGYDEPPEGLNVPAGQSYNRYFPGTLDANWSGDADHAPAGGFIAMAPQLFEGRVEYHDGTEATPEQMAEDVAEFLTWAADPHVEARKSLGFKVIVFLLILAVLLWFSYKQVWSNVEH